MTDYSDVPSNPYYAVVWLRRRHPWLDELMTRAIGPDDPEIVDGYEWVEAIIEGFNDIVRLDDRWNEYARTHRRPRFEDDEDAYYRWEDAGPRCETHAGRAIGPMSGGEKRMMRLITTLSTDGGPRCLSGWHVHDVDFDARGAAVVEDWIKVVRKQLTALQVTS